MPQNTLDRQIVLLGFKDNPTPGTDDCLDLGDMNATGCILQNYALGAVYINDKGRQVRDITMTLAIQGSSQQIDQAFATFLKIKKYILRTRKFLKPYGGNPPARSDGLWFPGKCATLSIQFKNATNMVYWNVLDGDIVQPPDLTDIPMNTGQIYDIQLRFTVDKFGRGTRVYLHNLINMGDFGYPFSTFYNESWADGGWAITGTVPTFKRAGTFTTNPKFGYAASYVAGNTATLTQEVLVNEYNYGDILLPRLSLLFPAGGNVSMTATLDIFNGTSYSTQQTFINLSAAHITDNLWHDYIGTAYTVAAGITKVRLSINITSITSGTLYFSGAAIWRNPTNNADPQEYLTSGGVVRNPYAALYNVQGDTEAPCIISVLQGATTTGAQVAHIGNMCYDPAIEYPLSSTFFMTNYAGTVTTGYFWDRVASQISTGNGTYTASRDAGWAYTYDRIPRRYRVFMVYAQNDATTGSKVEVDFNGQLANTVTNLLDSRFFNVTVPSTYVGTTNPPPQSAYKIVELGDYFFPRPGTSFAEYQITSAPGNTNTDQPATSVNNVGGVNRIMAVLGFIFLPADKYAMIDLGGTYTGSMTGMAISTETGVARPLGIYLPSSSNAKVYTELTSSYTSGRYTSDYLTVVPYNYAPCNQFDFMLLKSRDATYPQMYVPDAGTQQAITIEYTPRYEEGFYF